MNCPKCVVPLAMSDRQGIEIDYCPSCRGVWLDRGELDKIIERSLRTLEAAPPVLPGYAAPAAGPPPMPAPGYQAPVYRRRDDDDDDDDDDDKRRQHGQGYDQRKHKKKGFLGDLFDF